MALGADRIVARAAAELIARPGERVWVRPLPGRTLRFAESGAVRRE